MNAIARAGKEVIKAGVRTFAASSLPDRKVAILGAAGKILFSSHRTWCGFYSATLVVILLFAASLHCVMSFRVANSSSSVALQAL